MQPSGSGKGMKPKNCLSKFHCQSGSIVFPILSATDRQADGCHFRETGQLKTVESLAKAIGEAR